MPRISTTHPSLATDQNPSWGQPTHLRWLFPSPIAMAFNRSPLVVGRDEACDLTLAGNEISRRHAEFTVDGPVVAVRDLESRNGVFINGARRSAAPLLRGDVVRCGEWIAVAVSEAPDAPGFHEIAPGWFGGATLAAAVAPAARLTSGLSTDLAIIVQGETGTGKEGVARAIHGWSGRTGPFVAVNCAALPAELAEAELFGYRKGAFTGAHAASPGLFRAAHGGSLFLDEVLELPLGLQPKLLRVLEERRVRALGEASDVPVDVRIISASQEPLADVVAERRFRADLRARLEGLTIELPPLRERREDIVPLFFEFLRQESAQRPAGTEHIEAKLIEALCVYDWPLNVRELGLLCKRLVGVHGTTGPLRKAFLPERMLAAVRAATAGDVPHGEKQPDAAPAPPALAAGSPAARRSTGDAAEFDALIAALRSHGGSVGRAAQAIGIGRARAYRLLAAHPDFSLEGVRPKL